MRLREELKPDDIPGLREAIAQERFDRSVAFLGLPETVCGVACRPLTLLDVLRLDCIGSPFVVGGYVKPEDIGAFLKLQCTARSGFSKWRMLYSAARRLKSESAIKEIQDFIDEAFGDAPGGGVAEVAPHWLGAHAILFTLAEHNLYSANEALNTPLKVLLPFLKIIHQQADPKAALFNPRSDKVRGAWIAQQNKRN